MIAVIFEVTPGPGQKERYLGIAAGLRPILERIEGFVSIERFQSLTEPEKILSLSFFEDEAAVHRWRTRAEHLAAQRIGRAEVFADYRLRVAEVVRDYGLSDRLEAPEDLRHHHAPAERNRKSPDDR